MNWSEVGAIVGLVAVMEVPALAALRWLIGWVRSVDQRLEALEARMVPWDDPRRPVHITERRSGPPRVR